MRKPTVRNQSGCPLPPSHDSPKTSDRSDEGAFRSHGGRRAASPRRQLQRSTLVRIHASQFPEQIRRELLDSLRRRQINHKFHYQSVKQATKWLRLHRAYSPSKTDRDCSRIYQLSFEAAAARIKAKRVHVIGLGCGNGEKEAAILGLLTKSRETLFTPSDVSVPLVLTARKAASRLIAEGNCLPLVCDLQTANDLPQFFDEQTHRVAVRLCTFFGMIPNFVPQFILPRLASLIRDEDWLLFSANLAPGPNYKEGVEKILPLYDNSLTRDWLLTFLFDLGVEPADGKLVFSIEEDRAGLLRIAADFLFSRRTQILVDEERFVFPRGAAIRLFFSYRYTPRLVASLLRGHGLVVADQWITGSQEEGVFLCRCDPGVESLKGKAWKMR
jgi:hypothetical protein